MNAIFFHTGIAQVFTYKVQLHTSGIFGSVGIAKVCTYKVQTHTSDISFGTDMISFGTDIISLPQFKISLYIRHSIIQFFGFLIKFLDFRR